MSFEYYLRLTTRSFGQEYLKVLGLLVDMRRHSGVPEQLKDCIDEEMRAVGKYAGKTVELEESMEGEKRDAIAATEEMPEEPPGWSLTCMECKGLDVEFEVCTFN